MNDKPMTPGEAAKTLADAICDRSESVTGIDGLTDGDWRAIAQAAISSHNSAKEEEKCGNPKWIGVEERLPEKDQVCLIAYKEGYEPTVSMERFRGLKDLKSWTTWNRNSDEPVTHWMPLPDAPPAKERELLTFKVLGTAVGGHRPPLQVGGSR